MGLQVPDSNILAGRWFRRSQSKKLLSGYVCNHQGFYSKYDYNFRSLLEYSIYDTKTVNIFSTITENITHTKKVKHGTRQRRTLLKWII